MFKPNEPLTIGQLVEYLSGLDPKLRVGFLGHFGEFYPLVQRSHLGMRLVTNTDEPVLAIQPPDIGEEPD